MYFFLLIVSFRDNLLSGFWKYSNKSEEEGVKVHPLLLDMNNSKINDEVDVSDNITSPVRNVKLIDLQLTMKGLS